MPCILRSPGGGVSERFFPFHTSPSVFPFHTSPSTKSLHQHVYNVQKHNFPGVLRKNMGFSQKNLKVQCFPKICMQKTKNFPGALRAPVFFDFPLSKKTRIVHNSLSFYTQKGNFSGRASRARIFGFLVHTLLGSRQKSR